MKTKPVLYFWMRKDRDCYLYVLRDGMVTVLWMAPPGYEPIGSIQVLQ